MRVITFKADEDLIEILDKLAEITGFNRSEIIRTAVMILYNNYSFASTSKYLEKIKERGIQCLWHE